MIFEAPPSGVRLVIVVIIVTQEMSGGYFNLAVSHTMQSAVWTEHRMLTIDIFSTLTLQPETPQMGVIQRVTGTPENLIGK